MCRDRREKNGGGNKEGEGVRAVGSARNRGTEVVSFGANVGHLLAANWLWRNESVRGE